jgi:hypothetical protein
MGIKFSTNLPAWIASNKRVIEQLKDPQRVLKTAALNSLALISERIQVFGKLSNGSAIGGGQYNKQYAKKRAASGRQVRQIDYTFSGDLMQSFIAGPGPRFYALGFTDEGNHNKKEWLENMHGIAFELSQQEIDLAFKDIQNDVNRIITQGK